MALSGEKHGRRAAGVYGDRLYAFGDAGGLPGFPFLTGRELPSLLTYRPIFRDAERARCPPNLAEAEALKPGVTPLYPPVGDLLADVTTPSGAVLAIDDPALAELLRAASGIARPLTLLRSDRAITDCRPVSLIAVQTAAALGTDLGMAVDQRRFRANIYMDLANAAGFAENAFVGRSVRIGAKAVVAVLERDPRCKMITLDPDTGAASPEILRTVAGAHGGTAGIYGAVLVEGTVRPGEVIELL